MNPHDRRGCIRIVSAVTIILLSCSTSSNGPVEQLPPSTDLEIPLITQSIPSRSWLSCGRMVYTYRDSTFTLTECQLQSHLIYSKGDCCPDQTICDTSFTNLSPALLLSGFLRRSYVISKNAPALTMLQSFIHEYHIPAFALMKGSPFETAGHFVVVKGIRYESTADNPTILINDPLGYFPVEMSYQEFTAQCRMAAFLA